MEERSSSRKSYVRGVKIAAVLLIFGVVLCLAVGIAYPHIDRLVQDKINDELVLKPDSESYKNWQAPDVPIYLQFFVFDVVNHEEARQEQRPVVEQKGPYSYREYRKKKNITWSAESKPVKVTYDEEKWFVFDPETSCESCDPFKDYITTVNIPLVTLGEMARNWPIEAKPIVDVVMDYFKESLFTKRQVHGLLWGYPDPILAEYNKLRGKLVNLIPFLGKLLPEISPVIALQNNQTFDGFTTVYTGAGDIAELELWEEWNGKSKLGAWNTKYANMLNGTDGTQFAPEISEDDTLYVFVTELCRALYLQHNTNTDVHGIATLQFTVPSKLFFNATLNPDNGAFCTKKCYPTGILDVSVCQVNSTVSLPVFISAPHFYQGDPELIKNVTGLNPNEQDHGTFLDVEPHTGLPLSSSKRLQLNVLIQPIPGIRQTSGIRTTFVPIFYLNETATIDKKLADELKSKVISTINTIHGVEFGLLALGGILIVAGAVLVVLLIRKRRKLKMEGRSSANGTGETTPLLRDDVPTSGTVNSSPPVA